MFSNLFPEILIGISLLLLAMIDVYFTVKRNRKLKAQYEKRNSELNT